MTAPTTAACRRPRDTGVRRAVRVALAARAGGVYTGPRRPAPPAPLMSPRRRPCCHPRDLDALIGGPPAPPALHLANQPFLERYTEEHPLVRPLTPKWCPVARYRGSRADRPSRGRPSLHGEAGPPAARHHVATLWEQPASVGPSCTACESRQLTACGALAEVVLLVFLWLILWPRARLCQKVV